MATKQKDTNLTFREAFKELEALAAQSDKETAEFDIDEALKKYERGHELAEFCIKQLQTMKNKVVEVKKKFRLVQEEGAEEKDI